MKKFFRLFKKPRYEFKQMSPVYYDLNNVCQRMQDDGWEIAGQMNPFRCNQGQEWCMVVFKRRMK